MRYKTLWATTVVVAGAAVLLMGQTAPHFIPNLFPFPNPSGASATYTPNGPIDLSNPFFQELGTNGRSCGTCHQPDQGWTVAAAGVQARFDATGGTDPIFRTNDGSNCNHDIDTSTVEGRASAYSLLTSRGLIRIAIDVPPDAEFDVAAVQNPYQCNEPTPLSMYRRVLPATNLRALSAVMWDGRESTPPLTEKITYATNPSDLLFDLSHQSVDATIGHAQAQVPPTPDQQQQIVDLEMGFSTAQVIDNVAGRLNTSLGNGGPVQLFNQPFYVGINDSLGGDPKGIPFTPTIFTLYEGWANLPGYTPDAVAKAAIARGEALFNSRTIHITGVGGLNDDLGMPDIVGTCGTCHDTPNFGNHSLPVPLNIGVANLDSPLDVRYLPVITLRNKSTNATMQTTDPGRALITGKWNDIGKVKGPILRALAARAPYFHNGSAKTLMDVLNFYNARFAMNLTDQEKSDLLAFLSAL